MNFLSGVFYIFLAITLGVYYIVPNKYRYIVMFVASMIFYGWGNPSFLVVLLGIAFWTYIGGLVLSKKNNKFVYMGFFFSTLAILAIYKYTSLVMLVGLSFYIFQATTYLGDVYRGKIEVEKNFIKYGAFVAFFPTLLSGPIQKSRELLPQISSPKDFEEERFIKGLLLLAWGLLEKILVANKLRTVTEGIYAKYETVTWAHFFVTALAYSLYIYADFNSYSDMARGVAKLLGIEVGRNFKNPYLSTSVAEFWRRWHVSLNDWFIENVYIPLGGSRKGAFRKYFNMMLVFFVSGIWHGNGYNFVAWGIANGILVVIAAMLRPVKTNLYSKTGIDENNKFITFLRRVIVYILISGTWIFFANGTKAAIYIIKTLLTFNVGTFSELGFIYLAGNMYETILTCVFTAIFVIVQILRADEAKWYTIFKNSPAVCRYAATSVLVYGVIMASCSYLADVVANSGVQFIYFNF